MVDAVLDVRYTTEPGPVRYGIEDGLDHWPSAGGHVIYLTDAYWSKFLPPDRRHDESATHVIHERWHVVQFALMGLRGPEAGPKGLLEGTPEVIGPKWLLEAQATYLEGVCADRYGYKSLGETRGQRLPRAAEE